MDDQGQSVTPAVLNASTAPIVLSDCEVNLNRHTRRMVLFLFGVAIYAAGLALNILVVWVNWRHRNSPNGVLFGILNVAISDLASMIVSPFFLLEFTMDYHWYWGQFMCGFLHFIDHTTFYSSSYFLAYLSVERYLTAKRSGTRPWGPIQRRKRLAVCGALWVLATIPSILLSAHMTVSTSQFCFFYSRSKFVLVVTPIFIVVLQFVCPAVIIITCNLLTLWALRSQPDVQNRKGCGLSWILHSYSAVFVACWLPKQIFLVLLVSGPRLSFWNCKTAMTMFFFNAIVSDLSSIHCIANPILYNFISRGFRHNLLAAVNQLFSGKAGGEQAMQYHHSNSDFEGGVGKVRNDGIKERERNSSTSQSDVET